MVTVPFFCPDVPPLMKNPVFLYSSDRFQKPLPFQADIAVGIDEVFEQKLKAIDKLESQVYEGGANGSQAYVDSLPSADEPQKRMQWLRQRWNGRQRRAADQCRETLVKLYGSERGQAIQYAESFEICEYGRRPNTEEIKKLFPFYEKP